jgi:hypothetical protein
VTGPARRRPGPGAPPEAPRGGRLPRPALVAGVVVAALLALRAAAPLVSPPRSAGAEAGSSRPAVAVAAPSRPAELAEATGVSLLLGGEDGLFRVDVDARTVRPIPLPGRRFETDRGLIRRDGTVVAVHGGTAWVSTGEPRGSATRLGPASYALAATDPRRVWLVEETGDPERWFRMREVEVDRSPAPARPLARGTLPLSRRPVAAVPGGLLLDVVGPGGGLAVWDLRTGRLRHRFDTLSPVTVVAVSGGTVAWVEATTLHLGDLAHGRRRVVAAPAGSDGFAPAGAFSPDGRVLAAVTEVGFATRPALALVQLDRAQAVRVEGSEGALADRCSPCVAWAPVGDWVFFNRLGPGFDIGAYRLGHPSAVRVPLDVPGSFPPSLQTL